MSSPLPAKRSKGDTAIDVDELRTRMSVDWPNVKSCATQGELRNMLLAHDIPHRAARIEWWYVNGHLGAGSSGGGGISGSGSSTESAPASEESGKPRYSFFVAFFRLVVPNLNGELDNTRHSHAVNWAVCDHQRGKYVRFSELDAKAPLDIQQLIDRNEYRGDPHVLFALKELAKQQRVPAPDKCMPHAAEVSESHPMRIKMNENIFEQIAGEEPGTYRLVLSGKTNEFAGLKDAAEEEMRLEMTLKARGGPVLHGVDGVVSIGNVEGDMFYYFSPQCDVLGGTVEHRPRAGAERSTVHIAPSTESAVSGAWIDHEFGGAIARDEAEDRAFRQRAIEQTGGVEGAWEWAAIKFDDGGAASVTVLTDPRSGKMISIFAIVAEAPAPDSASQPPSAVSYRLTDADGVRFEAFVGCEHQSKMTGMKFPTKWKVVLPPRPGGTTGSTSRTLELVASVADQEFVTLPAKPSFWEGHVSVMDSATQKRIGHGFVECHGHKDLHDAEAYFEMLHTLLCAPLQGSVAKLAAAPDTAEAYIPAVAPSVEMMCAMSQMNGTEVSHGEKHLTKILCAAYIAISHHGAEVAARVREWAEQQWESTSPAVPNDFKRLLFRAFFRRQLDVISRTLVSEGGGDGGASQGAREGTPVTDVAATMSAALAEAEQGADAPLPPPSQRAIIPTLEELATPATPTSLAVATKYFTGVFVKSPERSQEMSTGTDIATFLAAQGVNLVVRTMTARLKPTLTSAVENMEVRTRIKTMVSDDLSVTPISGRSFEIHSPGRGKLTCRACLQHGGRVLAIRTELPENAAEYKWIYVDDEEGKATPGAPVIMVERLHYYTGGADARGEPPASACLQVYVKQ